MDAYGDTAYLLSISLSLKAAVDFGDAWGCNPANLVMSVWSWFFCSLEVSPTSISAYAITSGASQYVDTKVLWNSSLSVLKFLPLQDLEESVVSESLKAYLELVSVPLFISRQLFYSVFFLGTDRRRHIGSVHRGARAGNTKCTKRQEWGQFLSIGVLWMREGLKVSVTDGVL